MAVLRALQRGGQDGDGELGVMTTTVTGDGLAVLTRRGVGLTDRAVIHGDKCHTTVRVTASS